MYDDLGQNQKNLTIRHERGPGGQMSASTGRLCMASDVYSGRVWPHNSKRIGPAVTQVRQTPGARPVRHQTLLREGADMAQSTRAPARYDSWTRSSAAKITPASSASPVTTTHTVA
ncbi:hypothetical protein TPA0910_86860 [Streptomyces hygroscopicus subsp. sporocinereus]|uniref:Uncharacterized protein n=1 Tax=Streptomyces hygroscopicus TaxID=1912 RepID=A0ABQ3UG68_STRHY|nr:hypothetical protein TPA0910_86860 [Streptomyces hygroscopicus]